jgi:hypothetical protein
VNLYQSVGNIRRRTDKKFVLQSNVCGNCRLCFRKVPDALVYYMQKNSDFVLCMSMETGFSHIVLNPFLISYTYKTLLLIIRLNLSFV